MTPGEAHHRLEPLVGEWNAVMKTWWGGPGSPAMETKGSCERHWMLEGRFLREQFKGNVMMPTADGRMETKPFEGLSFLGYDNHRNLYQGTWMDSMGTAMLHYSGAADPAGKDFTFYGEMDEPTMQVVGRHVKYVTRIISHDKHVFEMYDLHAGDDYKVMEITYTRK